MSKILVSWSGGKDSLVALMELLRAGRYEVAGLLSCVTESYDRVSIHGVRRALLERQAESLGIRLFQVSIPKDATNEIYERRMTEALHELRAEMSVEAVAFGDLFLEDVRAYRERLLDQVGLPCIFPVWGWDTTLLIENFVGLGFKAVVVAADATKLDADFVGTQINKDFLRRLPAGVDPCGERGEFHTFVYDGASFKFPVKFTHGETVLRDGYYYRDLVESEREGGTLASGR